MLRVYLSCMFFLSILCIFEAPVRAQEDSATTEDSATDIEAAQEDPATAENSAAVIEAVVPMDLEAVALSPSEIQLTWSPQNRGQEGYVIERSDDGKSFTQIATLPGDATSFTDISLPASSKRYYRVTPYSASAIPETGELAAATTLEITASIPIAPSNLNVKVSASPALLVWNYRPPLNTDTYTVAKNYDFMILTERDETVREDLRSKGAPPPFIVYLMSNQIHDPGGCTKQPFKNQVADRIGDFCNISANHPDWFLKDKNGQRIFYLDGGKVMYYFMDPGNVGWRDFFIARAQESINSHGWDGIFLDNLDGTLNRFKRFNKIPVKYQTDSAYRTAVVSYLNDLSDSYFGPNNIPLYGNITEVGDGSAWFQYIPHMTGAMNENFAVKWNGQWHDLSAWQEHINRAAETATMGKKQILVCQGDQFVTSRQNFCYGSYLLIAAPGIYLRYSNTSSYNRIALYPNWNLGFGRSGWQSISKQWLMAPEFYKRLRYSRSCCAHGPDRSQQRKSIGSFVEGQFRR